MADATKLALQVATPLGMQLDLDVDSVQLPGAEGEFGVLPGHIPLLAALRPGVMRFKSSGGELQLAAVGAGFAEATASYVRVISEFYTTPKEVSVEEAKSDLDNAEQRLKTTTAMLGEPDQVEAQRDLDWARARLEISSGIH